MKLRKVDFLILFWCPGCKDVHPYDTTRWTFNGNMERPTFTPSLLVNANSPGHIRCHLYMTDGKIQFLPDCEHGLAGQTIDIADIPASNPWGEP